MITGILSTLAALLGFQKRVEAAAHNTANTATRPAIQPSAIFQANLKNIQDTG
jgi:hypothetical protein